MFKHYRYIYISLSIAAAFISFYKLGFLAKELSTENFGLYSFIMLSYVYLIYIGSFGANEYMLKIGSYLYNAADNKKLLKVRNDALFYGIIGVLFLSLAFIFLPNHFLKELDYTHKIIISVLAVSSITYNIIESYFRSIQSILTFSIMAFTKSIIVLVIAQTIIDKHGVSGVLFAEIISVISIIGVFFLIKQKEIVSSGISKLKSAFSELYKNGFYVSLSNLLRNITITGDRYFVVLVLGMHNLGVYSFVMILYQGSILATGILMNVLGPKIISKFSNEKSEKKLIKFILKIFILFSIILTSIYFLLPYFLTYIIDSYFSQYNTDLVFDLFNYVYISSTLTFFISIFDWYFISVSKEKVITLMSLISSFLISAMFISYYLDLYRFDIKSIVILFMFSRLIVFICMSTVLFKDFHICKRV